MNRREERQAELWKLDEWLQAHPFWAWGITIWIVLFLADLSELLAYVVNHAGEWIR